MYAGHGGRDRLWNVRTNFNIFLLLYKSCYAKILKRSKSLKSVGCNKQAGQNTNSSPRSSALGRATLHWKGIGSSWQSIRHFSPVGVYQFPSVNDVSQPFFPPCFCLLVHSFHFYATAARALWLFVLHKYTHKRKYIFLKVPRRAGFVFKLGLYLGHKFLKLERKCVPQCALLHLPSSVLARQCIFAVNIYFFHGL